MMISASILNADNRIDSVVKLNRTNISYVHIDVMDGKFVEDEQFSINEIKAIDRVSKNKLDVHLMVKDPIKYIEELSNMNIGFITFHLEVKKSIKKIISKIKEYGYGVGISINPSTDIDEVVPYLNDIDMVLVMSVEPGKGGQKFIEKTVSKVNKLKKIIDVNGCNVKIEVDGGINDTTISKLDNVDIAVVGSYITKSDNYYKRVNGLLSVFNKENNTNKKIISDICVVLSGIFFIIYLFNKSLNYILIMGMILLVVSFLINKKDLS